LDKSIKKSLEKDIEEGIEKEWNELSALFKK